jgi:hypothetical protein
MVGVQRESYARRTAEIPIADSIFLLQGEGQSCGEFLGHKRPHVGYKCHELIAARAADDVQDLRPLRKRSDTMMSN